MPIDYKRQTALFNPALFEHKSVSIIGVGNIGSHTALALARLGVRNLVLYDPDTIEVHNLSSQDYNINDIGNYKVDAVEEYIIDANQEVRVISIQDKFSDRIMSDIYIIGVDSLDARREIAGILRTSHPTDIFLIDGRIGGEQIELHMSRSPEEWLKTIPAKASPEVCGAQYISYCSMICGGLIANQVKKHLMGQRTNKNILLNVNSLDVMKDFDF